MGPRSFCRSWNQRIHHRRVDTFYPLALAHLQRQRPCPVQYRRNGNLGILSFVPLLLQNTSIPAATSLFESWSVVVVRDVRSDKKCDLLTLVSVLGATKNVSKMMRWV